MNIRDSYIHGADGKGVVKSLFFVTAADVQADNNLNLNDLGIILADANNSTFYLTIPTLNLNTTGYAALILTEKKSTNASYYLTFVDSNNNSATAESVYTNAGIYFNPTTGPTGHLGTLHVNNISGDNIGITIGNTFVALGGVYTPVTSITASSTDDDIPSAAAVWAMLSSGLQANDAMVFKGVLNGGTNTTYTPAAECGHVYKVAVAGKINGDYYEVGDTLICAADSTVAATSSNVSTVKTNWYAIQTNIADYLLKTGGTMTGNLKWKDTTALPTINSMANANILVVDGMSANTEGTTKQISLASLLNSMNLSPSIGAGTTTNTVKITVNGTDSSDYTIPYSTSANGAQKLLYQSMLGYRNDFDDFTNVAGLRVALFQNKGTEADGTNLVNLPFEDGSLVSFPWEGDNRYGAQLAVEDAGSTNHLAIRCRTGAANTWGAWAMILTSANYNLYSPKLDGTGASGTWAISISGNADTATDATNATNLTGNPSLQAGTSNTDAITVTAGNKTSAEFVVPYSTKTLKLISSGSIDTTTVNSFCEASVFKMAYLGNTEANTLFSGSDGFLFSVGVSGGYGHLIHIDDTSYDIWHRKTKGPNLDWDSWVKILDTSNVSPSLNISGNTIAITIGGVTSSYITVPFATTADKLVISSSSNVTKTLKVDEWTDMVAINSLTAGTYAIQISSGNVMASGIFTACGGTDSVIDEILLHVADKGTNTWRPYARISAGQLQMTTNEATGTSREYTINIVKLI